MANLDAIARLAELDALLLVDKPAGVPSNDVMKSIKAHFNLVKVGHGGSVDTNASGLFIVLLGNATRLASDIMGSDRTFEVTMRMGVSSNTFDKEGAVTEEKDASDIDRAKFDSALPEFKGDIFQTAPRFSAVKTHGKAVYEIIENTEEPKPMLNHVYRISVTDFSNPLVSLEIKCTKNTVVRALVNDIGLALGCGGTVESSRRTSLGRYSVADAVPFMDLMKMNPGELSDHVVRMNGLALNG